MIRAACFSVIATVAVVLVAVGITPRSAPAQTPTTSGGPVEPALLADLVAANRILAAEGVLDAYGHVSIRHPSHPNRYMMSRSLAPILVTADDIMEYDLDSTPVDPQGRTSVLERFIHGEIYKARADVKAVIHSHSPAVVPFGVTQVPMRPLMHVASFLWVGVPVFEIRDAGDPATTGCWYATQRSAKLLP
jgi:ribulose-5-phosphate 4-epimerase/fuculose-1-phosphate aldolase